MQPIPVIYTTTPVSRFRRHEMATTQSQYHDMMLKHIKVVSKYKNLLALQEARAYDAHTMRFLLRRIKRLLLDGHYDHFIQYLHYTMTIARLQTLKTFLDFILSKFKITRRGITSV